MVFYVIADCYEKSIFNDSSLVTEGKRRKQNVS